MKLIRPSYEILTPIDGLAELQTIERAARTCYKSESAITEDGESAKKLIRRLIENGHEAMLEHSFLSVKFTVDRGVTHELVRHRLCSFAQESTRYCNYSGEKFGHDVRFVIPYFFAERHAEDKPEQYILWVEACRYAEEMYFTAGSENRPSELNRRRNCDVGQLPRMATYFETPNCERRPSSNAGGHVSAGYGVENANPRDIVIQLKKRL